MVDFLGNSTVMVDASIAILSEILGRRKNHVKF